MLTGPGKAVIPSEGGFPMDVLLPSATAPLYFSHGVTESCCHCSSLCPKVPSVPGQPQAAGICGQLWATELTLCVAALCVSPLYPATDFLKACQNFAKSLCSGQWDHKLQRNHRMCVNIILHTEAHTKDKPTQFWGKHFFQDSGLNYKNKAKR